VGRLLAALGAELLPMVFTSGWASGVNAYAANDVGPLAGTPAV
jgi:hypothetical protein